jgi:hypothetical protein
MTKPECREGAAASEANRPTGGDSASHLEHGDQAARRIEWAEADFGR